jgi:tRNA (guanine-N7-)-methyltransferase
VKWRTMGRRALRKLDPALDLSRHLIPFDALPRPWNRLALFEHDTPLEVEVGCGKGLFLAGAATAQPKRNFLGIELATRYARFAASRLAKLELANARLVHGDAKRLFAELLPDECLAAVHVYFPDPWWKARHKKRRVMTAAFLKDIERSLVPGGALHFWTDVEEYFCQTLALLAEMPRLTGTLPAAERDAAHDLDYRTHFERRMRLQGKPVYRAEFRKRL